MAPNQFYITLPSSANLDLYPENTLSKYITELYNTIDLEKDKYEVGMCQFTFNGKIYNIENKVHLFTVYRTAYSMNIVKDIEKEKHVKKLVANEKSFYYTEIYLKPGFYNDINDIIKVINKQLSSNKLSEGVIFKYVTDHQMECKITPKYGRLSRKNFRILPETNLFKKINRPENIPVPNYSFNYFDIDISTILATPKLCFIYSNLIEFQYVGDSLTQLLRIVEIENPNITNSINIIYNTIHYVPVRESILKRIEINIKTVEGYSYPFDFGHLLIKLHFRKEES